VHLIGFIKKIYHDAHVEFYSKSKSEKLVHLIGFIKKIYHDARSSERQINLQPRLTCRYFSEFLQN